MPPRAPTRSAPGPEPAPAAASKARELELKRANRAWRPRRHRSLWLHWLASWLRRPARARITPLPTVAAGQVAVSFAGHSSVLIRYQSLTIACDPMLGRHLGLARRESEPGLSPADLEGVSLVLISHGRADHLHEKTLATLPRSATVVVPPKTAAAVSRFGFARVVELAVGQSFELSGVGVFACAARRDDGPSLSYVIRGPAPSPSVYFCGDSGYFSGFAEVGERHRPDIALLPIGGYSPASFRARHMSPADALFAFEDLGSRVMIPIHHGAFALSYERLGDPRRWLEEIVAERALEAHVISLHPGESRLFVAPRRQPLEGGEGQHEPADAADDGAGSAVGAVAGTATAALPQLRAAAAVPSSPGSTAAAEGLPPPRTAALAPLLQAG